MFYTRGERDVQCGIHYPFPIYELPAHADLGYKHGDFPEAERAASRQLSLPIYPELRPEQIETVAAIVAECVDAR